MLQQLKQNKAKKLKPVILIWRILQGRNLTSRALQSLEVAVDRQEPMVLQR